MAVEPRRGDLPPVNYDQKVTFDDDDDDMQMDGRMLNERSTVPTNLNMSDLWKTLKLEKNDYEKYRAVFKKVDNDGDGELSIDEIGEAFRNLNMHLSEEQLKDLMFDNDLDGSGLIDEREFLIMVSGKKKLRTVDISRSDKVYVQGIFDYFKKDGGDYWSYSAFREYFDVINKEQNVAPLNNQDFMKVNMLLGAKEEHRDKMHLRQLEKFYSLLDRQVKPNLKNDYNVAIAGGD